MRVLHIVNRMNKGGAETFIMNNFRTLKDETCEFYFMVSNVGEYDEEIKNLNGKIYLNKNLKKNPIKYLFKYFILLKKNNIDVVHSHMFSFSGILLLIARLAGVKVRIAHSHSTTSVNNKFIKRSYLRLMRFLIKNNATTMIACGVESGKFLFKNNKFEIINNAIDLKKFKRISEKEIIKIKKNIGININDFVIGHVGRFEEVKNHKVIIKVFYDLYKSNNNMSLVLVGSGSLFDKVKDDVVHLGIEKKVFFLGSIDNVESILNIMDLFFMPSIFEGLPLSVIEAQAIGKKCLLSNSITNEVDIGANLVEYFDLNNTNEAIDIINNILYSKYKNKNFNIEKLISQKGYDIEDESKRLMKIYLEG